MNKQIVRELQSIKAELLVLSRLFAKGQSPKAEVPKILLSLEEAAQAIGNISVKSIRRAVASKKIKCTRMGRRVLIPVSQLQELADLAANDSPKAKHGAAKTASPVRASNDSPTRASGRGSARAEIEKLRAARAARRQR